MIVDSNTWADCGRVAPPTVFAMERPYNIRTCPSVYNLE